MIFTFPQPKIMQSGNHSTKKRQRSQNWLDEDKILLRELVIERVDVIENKNTDTATNNKKTETWLDLQDCFNCMCKGSQRTIIQLKNQWGFLKLYDKRQKAYEPEIVCKTEDRELRSQTPNTDPLDSEEFNDNDDEDEDKNELDNRINQKRVFAAAENVAAYEIECRRQLHRAQFENERKKGKNLELEAVLLKTKTEYYRQKLLSLNNAGNTNE